MDIPISEGPDSSEQPRSFSLAVSSLAETTEPPIPALLDPTMYGGSEETEMTENESQSKLASMTLWCVSCVCV